MNNFTKTLYLLNENKKDKDNKLLKKMILLHHKTQKENGGTLKGCVINGEHGSDERLKTLIRMYKREASPEEYQELQKQLNETLHRDWYSIDELEDMIYNDSFDGIPEDWVFEYDKRYIPKEVLETISPEYRNEITGAIYNLDIGQIWLTNSSDPYGGIYHTPEHFQTLEEE